MPPIDVAYRLDPSPRPVTETRYRGSSITCQNTPATTQNGRTQRPLERTRSGPQVPLLTVMVGNLAEKSLALAATFTATWRATAL